MAAKRFSNKYILLEAQQLEKTGDTADAVRLYETAIKNDPLEQLAYQRLMIIYRKEKNYKKELGVINAAIKSYEDHTLQLQRDWLTKHRKIARLAKSLVKTLGLQDRKGLPVTESDHIKNWRKRKQVVQQKLRG